MQFHTSFSSLPPRRRFRLMILLPFLDDPYAKLLALRELCKSKKDYLAIQQMPNSALVIWELFQHDFRWLTEKPTAYTFSKVNHMGWTFLTPSPKFEEITFFEFIEMDVAWTKYLKYQKESYFDNLLDTLYEVNQEGKVSKSTVIKSIPYPYRIDAFRMHGMIREKVFTVFKNLFPKVKSLSENEETKKLDLSKIQDSTQMWHSLLFSLADTPAFQGLDTAKASNMWEALTYLDEKAFQAAQAREEYNLKKK